MKFESLTFLFFLVSFSCMNRLREKRVWKLRSGEVELYVRRNLDNELVILIRPIEGVFN